MKSITVAFIFLVSLNVNSQSKTNKITKIILGTGYCNCCMGECPIEIIELDSTLKYSYYTEYYGKNISLSKGNASQEMWDSFSQEIERFNKKRLGYKSPFQLVKAHPIVIQIFKGTKSKIFYSDIEILEEEVWRFYEKIIKSHEQIKLKREEEYFDYTTNSKILNFLNSNQDDYKIKNLKSIESMLNNSERINNQTLDLKFRLKVVPDNAWILELKRDSTFQYSYISGLGNGNEIKGTYEINNNILKFTSINDDSDLALKTYYIIISKTFETEKFIDCFESDSKTYCLLSIEK